jgi:predicted small lipoprotein YifL
VARGRSVQSLAAAGALLLALSGCGGGGPKTDADAVAQTLKDAAKQASEGKGDEACAHLTPDAQRQAVLQVGAGVLGNADCPQIVKRAQFALTPLDKQRIKSLQPSNVVVNGTAASATMSTDTASAPGQGILLQLTLQKVGGDWKISGFVNQQGLPGG